MKPAFRPPLPAHSPDGGAAPVVLVVLALALSAGVFFLFTKGRMEKASGVAPNPATQTAPPQADPSPPPPPVTTPTPVTPPSPPVTPPQERFGFAKPADLGKTLIDKMNARQWDSAARLAVAGQDGADAAVAAGIFKKLVAELGFQPGSADEVVIVGQSGPSLRLSLPFTTPAGTPLTLALDVERDPQMGWKIAQFKLPPEMAAALAASTAPLAAATPMPPAAASIPPGTPSASPTASPPMHAANAQPTMGVDATAAAPPAVSRLFVVETTADALTSANAFVAALLGQDFQQARTFIDEARVPSERLAALCIVFEEGRYRLMSAKPLVMTIASDDVSWVIAQVESDELGQKTEFGLELQRAGTGAPWRVVGLNLSDILGSFAQSAGKMGVPYTPIVKNPRGGESLALYFEYDEAGLHPRAAKQLDIVASLLKSDDRRRLRIAGHTDALGSDDYNLQLSQQRAETVKSELVARGVADEQIETTGLGKDQPLGPNLKQDGSDNPEGRSKNRRAEIYLDF